MIQQCTFTIYYQLFGFWLEQMEEICHKFVLLLDIIRCQTTGCCTPKHLALFLLLRRWHIAGNWESVSYDLHLNNAVGAFRYLTQPFGW